MMIAKTSACIGRQIAALLRRWRFPILARPLGRSRECDIDSALRRAGLTRADLFTPANAIACHRIYMSYMLAARQIDTAWAAAMHWQVLKLADDTCAHCPNTGRCRRWLESQGPS